MALQANCLDLSAKILNMKNSCVFLICLLLFVCYSTRAAPTYSEETFSKRGCYQTPKPRPATLLFNRSDWNRINWKAKEWDNFIEKIVHDCGIEAKKKSFKYFCIESFGECWGHKSFHITMPHAPANKCWGKRPNVHTCDDRQKNPICVGTAGHGYIYELN